MKRLKAISRSEIRQADSLQRSKPGPLKERAVIYRGKRVWFHKLPLLEKYVPTRQEEKLIKKVKDPRITDHLVISYNHYSATAMLVCR